MRVSIDNVDFEIAEPVPFDRKWFSHKHNGSDLRYEVGSSINSGHIVWAYGVLPCGQNPDLILDRELFVEMLDDNENSIGDKEYNDSSKFIIPSNCSGDYR